MVVYIFTPRLIVVLLAADHSNIVVIPLVDVVSALDVVYIGVVADREAVAPVLEVIPSFNVAGVVPTLDLVVVIPSLDVVIIPTFDV